MSYDALMRSWLFALLFLPGGPAFAQPSEAGQRAKEIEAVCAKAHCRAARTVRLRLEDGKTFEKDVPRLPIVLPNGWITVYPGEEIHIEVTVKGDAIRSARAVQKVTRRSATVSFKLGQPAGRADSELTVTNGLAQNLKYSLAMMLPTGGKLLPSESCPVQPGVTAHETWSHPVFQLVIRDLRFLPADAPLNCGR